MNNEDVVVIESLVNSLSLSIHRTRGGSLAVVFTHEGKGDKPLLGAYYSGSEWIVCQWGRDGLFIEDEHRKLDLIVVSDKKEIA